MVGIPALETLFTPDSFATTSADAPPSAELGDATLSDLVADLELDGHGLVMCMGKGGVGKTTVLSALAGRARVFSGVLEARPGLRLSLQTQDVPPVDGMPLSGRELLALTGATVGGLPPWLAGRIDDRLDRLRAVELRVGVDRHAVVVSGATLDVIGQRDGVADRAPASWAAPFASLWRTTAASKIRLMI